jgi:hypothetical protein
MSTKENQKRSEKKHLKSLVILFLLSSCGYATTIQRPIGQYPGLIEYGKAQGRKMAYKKAKEICGLLHVIVVSDQQSGSSIAPVPNFYTGNTIYVQNVQRQLRFICR